MHAGGMLVLRLAMPYATNDDLPARVRRVLPEHAQDIYRAAFNDAGARYGTAREAVRVMFGKSAGTWWRERDEANSPG